MTTYSGQVLDEFDRPVPGATIYAFRADGTYADVSPATQPVPTDEFGNYSYTTGDVVTKEETWYGGKRRYVRELIDTALDGALSAQLASLAVTPQQFGATGDGVTDDSAAFVAAIAYLKSIAGNSANSGIYIASPKLFVPAGHYYLGTTTLDITHTLMIEGEGGLGFGAGGGAATKLRWAAGTTGIRVQANNTSGASTVDGVSHTSGAFTTLKHMYLCGPAVANTSDSLAALSLTEGEYHGLHVKATVQLEYLMIEGFQGDALYSHTTIGGGSPDEGFSNNSAAFRCHFRNSRNGVSIEGADANVWCFSHCQFDYNRACGVDDQSFLGNTYISPHTNGNGINLDNDGSANFPAYVVSYSGNRYCAVQGQESGASTNAPSGTTADNTWWYYLSAGAAVAGIPTWTSGIHVRSGAPYRTTNANSENVFLNSYSEGGQGYSQFKHPTMIINGQFGSGPPKGDGTYQRADNGYLLTEKLNVTTDVALAGQIGFFGHASGPKPSIGGSRGGNAALADLLTKLAALGLITDGTTA